MTTFSQLDHPQIDPDLLFPDSDGKPMADNTEQFRWIVTIKENLEIIFESQPDVFIAGDLLWYPLESTLLAPTAPDVMVIFGRPKGKRGSYKQWKENNIAPQVAFEILSPSNTGPEMVRKREFYETYGVEEYYQYDPDRLRLKGWIRQGGLLVEIPVMNGWVSPLLGIRFGMNSTDMEIYRPNGMKFFTSVELDLRARQAEAIAQQQSKRAEFECERAELERERAERAIAETERQTVIAGQAMAQTRQMIQSMVRSGMAVEQVALVTGMAIDVVKGYLE
jgi:Uma2 family endonuclease